MKPVQIAQVSYFLPTTHSCTALTGLYLTELKNYIIIKMCM